MSADTGQIHAGQVIDGKYRIVRLLGTGGMGAVYEGENTRIRRKVAIKVLHAAASSQPDVVTRFEREAQAAALVGSEHICEVLDLGVLPDGTRYMVMEYLDGETFSGRIKRSGRLAPPQSIPIMIQVLDALGAAHTAGIIHRDLKPDNIFILPQKGNMRDFVKILDFGVSKFSQLGGEEMNVTRAGAVVGTPYYMSPEQARGSSAIDARTDIYAIGVLLYQASTGQVPFQAQTFNELLFKIVLEVAPPPQTYAPDVDPDFAGIIQKAMAREPAQRFQSCQEFRDALLAYQAARAVPMPGLPGMGGTGNFGNSPLPNDANQRMSWTGTSGIAPSPAAGLGATPTPLGGGSGASWGTSSGAGQAAGNDASMATANSWQNASATVVPKSKTPMMIAIAAAAVLLVGGGIAAFLTIGNSNGASAQATGAASASAEPVASSEPSAEPVASTEPSAEPVASSEPSAEPAASAEPEASAEPSASADAPDIDVDTPSTAATNTAPKPWQTNRPTGVKPPPTSKPATGNDLGY